MRSLAVALAGAATLAGQPVRPANHFAIGDLVEDRSHGNQIVEIAGGMETDGGYSVLIPGAGPVLVMPGNLKLKARADSPVTCSFQPGDIVRLTRYSLRERGVVNRATGAYCEVKTSSSQSYEDCSVLEFVQAAPRRAAAGDPPSKATFTPGQPVQVRSGGHWIPAVVVSFHPDLAWYTIQFPNAAAQRIPALGYASTATLRKSARK